MEIDYTELGWQDAILLGMALREGLLEATAEGPITVAKLAEHLGPDPRAVRGVLDALGRKKFSKWMKKTAPRRTSMARKSS